MAETLAIAGLRKLTSSTVNLADIMANISLASGVASGAIAAGSTSINPEDIANSLKSVIDSIKNDLFGIETQITEDQWFKIKEKLPRRMGILIRPPRK